MDKEQNVEHFLSLIRKAKRGHLKIYIGMIAGVGKTYRMLREAHDLLTAGVDVQVGYVETHGRVDTAAKLEGLPVIPRKKLFYKGKEVEEMDLQAILQIHPEVVIVDELAHTNIEGCVNEKRWQDVLDLLDAGINVITAVNIQHIESLNGEVQDISGIEVKERVPDSVLGQADEVVNIDLTADELIERLKAGKIYRPDKIAAALGNFFTQDNLLQLRELALKEVALRVEKKVDSEVTGSETSSSAIASTLSGTRSRISMPVISSTTSFSPSICWMLTAEMTLIPASRICITSCHRLGLPLPSILVCASSSTTTISGCRFRMACVSISSSSLPL